MVARVEVEVRRVLSEEVAEGVGRRWREYAQGAELGWQQRGSENGGGQETKSFSSQASNIGFHNASVPCVANPADANLLPMPEGQFRNVFAAYLRSCALHLVSWALGLLLSAKELYCFTTPYNLHFT